ncbi:KICSTOR complex protein szt2 [Chytriomyces hyalinus]|nr:KICSTOR complex protein szt2 [Chytriomyces hyalinus]
MAKVESCVDLKAIALIWRDNEAATRADREGWALGVIMRRMRVAELLQDPHVDILDLSAVDSVFEWERDKESTKRSTEFDPDARVRITPSTRIVTLSRKHKVAFVVDVSASMRVVDSSEEGLNRILVPLCFETLCNCLDGMSRPFAITNSWTGQTTEIFPEIYVTVLAKAGASMGYRPDLSPRAHAYISRHPVHVLLQDVQVTHLNLLIVAETLYMSLNAYENEMIELRHMDDRHGMHLQNETHDPSTSATRQPLHPEPLDHSNHDTANNPVLAAGPQKANTEPPPLNTLEHGLLALRLLPPDCSPVLIALTDGVSMSLMKGEFVYRDVCRRLSRDAVQVSIIQVGSNRGFYPSVNFGYVPDNEALRFIAFATFGKLLYASDCKYLDPIISEDNQYPTPPTANVPSSATSSDSFSSIPASYSPPPNFYHRHLIMRDIHLAKQKCDTQKFQERHVVGPPRPVDTPRVRRINTDIFTASSEETTGSAELDFVSLQRTREAKFPWNAASAPPIVAEILCGCSDYNVEAPDLAILINARLLEGFSLKCIQIGTTSDEVSKAAVTPKASTNKRAYQQKDSVKEQASGSIEFAGLAGEKGDKLEIILMRPWLPSVIIQYTIKARISLDAQRAEKSILLCVLDKKKPRIELNILAHHTFALGFVNSSEGKPKNDRFGKLAMYLKGIREADSLLHLLSSFNQKPVLCSIPKFDARLFPTSNTGSSVWNLGSQPMHSSSSTSTANTVAADSANLWTVFCHFMINKSASFDDCDVDIILRSSNPNRVLSDVSPLSYPPSLFSNNSSRGVHAKWALSNRESRSRLPSALIHIMTYLANEWSLFALNRTTFVKLYYSSDPEVVTSPTSTAAAASGLVVLRMVHETDWLLSMRLTFFNVPLQGRLSMKSRLCQTLSLMRVPCTVSKSGAPNLGAVYSPLRICEKPVRRMMVRYRFINENEGLDHTADIGTSNDDVTDDRPTSHQNNDDTLNPTMNQTTAKSERTLKYATLISPIGPRSYLRSHRWIWLADVNVQEPQPINRSSLGQSMVSLKSADGGSASGSHLVSILDMALYLLYFARLEEGFLLLSHLHDSVTMYREIMMEKPIQCLDGQGNAMNVDEHGEIPTRRVTCGVQFIILIDRLERTVVTELWAEPVLEGDGNAVSGMNSNQEVKMLFREMHDSLAKLIMEADSKLFEGLYTFERVHLIGRHGSDIPVELRDRSRGSIRRENLRSRATSVHSQRQGAVEEQTARLTSVELNEPGRKLSVMRTKYSIDAILRKSKVSCIVYAAPSVTETSSAPAGVGVGLISDDQMPQNQIYQFKSEGDLAASRNTSPGQALDSPRPCASTDHLSFYRRSSHATGINGGKQSINATNPLLSIGLSWDLMDNAPSPQALIRVLLLKFFQNAMGFVTDSEIAFPQTYSAARRSGRANSAIHDSLGNVVPDTIKELDFNTLEQLKELVSITFENQVLMSRLDECVCFVKVRSPEQFVLVFLPRAASDSFHGSHLSITLLECSRARVHDTMSGKERLSSLGFDHCKDDNSEGHIKWSVKMKNLNEAANGSILVQSEFTHHSRTSEKEMGFEVNPNEYIDLFVSTVSDAYAIAHCKSVYAALVQSVGVSLQDVEKALFNCFEKTIDIDLTPYLNALTLTYQRMHSSRSRAERNRIVNSFQHIMNNKFRQLLTYAGNENCYYYNPDDSDEGPTQMRIESADTPLFLKTEVIFKKVVGSQVETAVVPMTALPTSYWVPVTEVEERHCEGSAAIDFRPLSIGNPGNPLASNDGTVATLRISCLSLFQPKKLYGNNDDTFDNEIYERALDDPRLILSLEKIDALYETVDQIKALIENEVMNGLLDLPSAYEQFSVDYIRYCLSSRHQVPSKFSDGDALQQFIHSSTGVFDLPLEFVKNQHDTKHIMGEFSKIQIPNAILSFTQLNEFFCITGNFQAAVNPKKHSFVRETFAETQQPNEKSMPGLRGLGISFPESESLDVSQFLFCRKSWALVSFKPDLARIWFVSRFTSVDEKLDLLSWIYDAIQDTSVAVNRLILLNLLKKTHRASKFLIKRADNDDSSDEDDEDEDHHAYSSHSFVPGQFACPIVSSHTFPIHWRLKPLNALSIATASINILGISNRNNMFVFEEDGKVVYFKLSVKEVELDQSHVSAEATPPASDDIASSSEPLMMVKGSPKTSSPLISRKPVGLGSAHSIAPQKSAESVILLEFFGVDGSLNANEFVTIIEAKLGGLVQKEIGTYISRNSATVKLTPADVEFILPAAKRPQRGECFKMPDFVLDKLGFMLLFKQALSVAFNALPSVEIGSALKDRFEREYGISNQVQGDRQVCSHHF